MVGTAECRAYAFGTAAAPAGGLLEYTLRETAKAMGGATKYSCTEQVECEIR